MNRRFFLKFLLEFFTAVQYFTRFPVPKFTSQHYSEDMLNRSRTYFPFIGFLIATIMGFSFIFFHNFLSLPLSILITMLFGILATGGFHEDGLADVCDGFGGGYDRRKILEIMKDSRLGTFGALGLICILAIRYNCFFEMATVSYRLFLSALFFAHTLSRFFANLVSNTLEYARDDIESKTKPIAKKRLSPVRMGISTLPIFLSTLFLIDLSLALAFIPALLIVIYMIYYFRKHIGGFTGDCLGAIQQVSETIIYIAILGIWKFYSID